MTLLEQLKKTVLTYPGSNLEECLRLMGRSRLQRSQDRQRLSAELEPGGRLGVLTQVKDGTTPTLWAEKYDDFGRRQPMAWEKPLIAAGYVRSTDIPEPEEPQGDDAIRSLHLRDQRRLLDALRMPDTEKSIMLSVADDLIAHIREVGEERVSRVLGQFLVLGGVYGEQASDKTAIASLRGSVEDKERVVRMLTHSSGRRGSGANFKMNEVDDDLGQPVGRA